MWKSIGAIVIGLSVLLGAFGIANEHRKSEEAYERSQREPPFNPVQAAALKGDWLLAMSRANREAYLAETEERSQKWIAEQRAKGLAQWQAEQTGVMTKYLGFALVAVLGASGGYALMRLDKPRNTWRRRGQP